MRFAAIGFVLMLSVCAAHAQSNPPRREDSLQNKLQSTRQLEMIEAALMRRPASANDRNTTLAQVREDFWRIQLANDNLIASLSNPAIDSRLIAKTAADIRNRAKRLKENLALPDPEKESKTPADVDAGDLRSSIASLSKLIDSFVNNPMLSQRHVVDATLSLTASRDLEQIIMLSGEIKKSAAKLE